MLPWRENTDPYRVWISEIMLQQTRVEAVIPYYLRFLSELPDIASLAAIDDDALHKLWEGLGYYRRAANLKKCAQVLMADYGGVFPQTLEEVLALPGIGPYTAGAICSICFDLPTPAVDGNVLRVLSRLTLDPSPVDLEATKKEAREKLAAIYPEKDAGKFTQSLMELGATVCLPNGTPNCADCPLADLCCAHRENRTEEFPVKNEKKPRTVEEKTVFLLSCGGRIALLKRPETGLLAGLFELPNVEGFLSEQEALDRAGAWELLPRELLFRKEREHIFTHRVWRMRCYGIRCERTDDAFLWASEEELISRYALPTAFRKFLEDQ